MKIYELHSEYYFETNFKLFEEWWRKPVLVFRSRNEWFERINIFINSEFKLETLILKIVN